MQYKCSSSQITPSILWFLTWEHLGSLVVCWNQTAVWLTLHDFSALATLLSLDSQLLKNNKRKEKRKKFRVGMGRGTGHRAALGRAKQAIGQSSLTCKVCTTGTAGPSHSVHDTSLHLDILQDTGLSQVQAYADLSTAFNSMNIWRYKQFTVKFAFGFQYSLQYWFWNQNYNPWTKQKENTHKILQSNDSDQTQYLKRHLCSPEVWLVPFSAFSFYCALRSCLELTNQDTVACVNPSPCEPFHNIWPVLTCLVRATAKQHHKNSIKNMHSEVLSSCV